MQLLLRKWLVEVEGSDGQKRLAVTDKGLVFLEKWIELQNMVGLKHNHKMMHENKIQSIIG
jgi:hypothetical protein